MEYFVWSLTVLLMLVGLVGTFVPLLPGTLLILVGALLHKLILPESISWFAFAFIVLFFLLSVASDIACTLIGTKLFGGTKWGMAGAGGGAMIGMFFSLPALLLGTILGAVAAEKLGAGRTHREALRAGAGAAIGFVASTIARLGCAFAMIAIFLAAAIPR
jgi:uncharacterized protein